ncbi:MAG: SMC-Scp complex subunit ScpB [Christensenellales bacterium]
METRKLISVIESLLFVSGEALAIEDIAAAVNIGAPEIESALEKMQQEYAERNCGISLIRVNDKIQFGTNKDNAEYIRKFFAPIEKRSLSQSAMETLSIIAYRQPVTKSEVERIRGVMCDYSISMLAQRGLIAEVGRKDALGRPILYGTTEEFLRQFGISGLSELPGIEELSRAELDECAMEEAIAPVVDEDMFGTT